MPRVLRRAVAALITVAAVAVAATITAPASHAATGTVLYFLRYNEDGSLKASDRTAIDILERQGLTIVPRQGAIRSDEYQPVAGKAIIQPSDLDGKDLIVVSDSVFRQHRWIKDNMCNLPTPIVSWENDVADEMCYADKRDPVEDLEGQTQINITGSHAVTAGLSGRVTIFANHQTFGPYEKSTVPDLQVLATSNTGKPVVVALDAGDRATNGTNRARRVGLFMEDGSTARLNSDGIKLLGQAFQWALGSGGGGGASTTTAAPTSTTAATTTTTIAGSTTTTTTGGGGGGLEGGVALVVYRRTLSPTDTALRNVLTGLGLEVTVVPQGGVDELGNPDLVVVAPSVNPGTVAPAVIAYRDGGGPVLSFEPLLVDDLGVGTVGGSTTYGGALDVSGVAGPGPIDIFNPDDRAYRMYTKSGTTVLARFGGTRKEAILGRDAMIVVGLHPNSVNFTADFSTLTGRLVDALI